MSYELSISVRWKRPMRLVLSLATGAGLLTFGAVQLGDPPPAPTPIVSVAECR